MITQLKPTDLKNLLTLMDPEYTAVTFTRDWIRALDDSVHAATFLSMLKANLGLSRSTRTWSTRQEKLFDWVSDVPANLTEVVIASLPREHVLNTQPVDTETWDLPMTDTPVTLESTTMIRLADGTMVKVSDLTITSAGEVVNIVVNPTPIEYVLKELSQTDEGISTYRIVLYLPTNTLFLNLNGKLDYTLVGEHHIREVFKLITQQHPKLAAKVKTQDGVLQESCEYSLEHYYDAFTGELELTQLELEPVTYKH